MTLVRALVLGAAVTLAAAAVAQDKKTDKKADAAKAGKLDPAQILGTWKISGGSKAGEMPSADATKGTVTFEKDTITLKGDDGMSFVIGYKIDAKADPATIDMDIQKPEELKSSAKGIIKFSDETITLCYHPMGGERPKSFEATKDNGLHMFTLKKAGSNPGELKKREAKEEKTTEKKGEKKTTEKKDDK